MTNLSSMRPECGVPGPTDQFVLELEAHWVNTAGLRENTRKRYLPTIRRFLAAQFPTGAVDWTLITAIKIAEFVTTELPRSRNRHTQKLACSSIRSLLRYVRLKHSLAEGPELVLPRLPYWRHAPIPQRLSESQLSALTGTCAGELPADLRRRCLLSLFTRLGMRTGEVAALAIDDIDWSAGCIHIKDGKNRRDRSLPLPVDVGEALVAHLRSPRPQDAPRLAFLASRAPYSPTQNYDRVRAEIRKMLQEAGISGVRLGAHVLRHTIASSMVNRGASFKEVADLLGHKSLQTTTIYAKLDLTTLSSVALPWAGGGQ
jgi:site-specific recombinase XerD